jgi:D-alanyl-D-alanine dipeptidase
MKLGFGLTRATRGARRALRKEGFYIVKQTKLRLRRPLPVAAACCLPVLLALAAAAQSPPRGALAGEPLVDVARVAPGIVIDLRYATPRNITGHPIYPPGAPCLLRRGVAEQLKAAQTLLRPLGYRLKIWDAYRPSRAQQILWAIVRNAEVVADPATGGSRHSWGVAVDVTLVDPDGRDVPMPTDFDDFTPAAKSNYTGSDPAVARNLLALKTAMDIAGFEGIRDEWWHYSAKNWRDYGPIFQPFETPETPSPSPVASATPQAAAANPVLHMRPGPVATPAPAPQ